MFNLYSCKMNKTFILWLLLGLVFQVQSQTITIQNSETGEAIEMATLHSESPEAFTTTNAKGQADISAFRGAQIIEIRSLGFRSEYKSYTDLSKAGFQFKLYPSSLNIDGVVVSATRWNQTTGRVPSKIITLSPREIALQNPQTAADLLSVSGKVFIQKSQQGGGSPMIRGFATNRLLYTIDGVRMNTAIFRSGNIQNVISLDPFTIENAEVFFGPGSVIYGSDAIGGVMSFQTLTPQLSLEDTPLITGKAVTRYASANNEKTGHFNVNLGFKKWALVSSFSSNDFGDLRMGSDGPDEYLRPFYVQRIDSNDVVVTNDDPRVQNPSGYSQINMMQKLRYKPNEQWDFQYGFHFSETSEYSRYDRHIRYKNGLPRYGEWSYGPQKWMMNNLSVNHHGNNKFYDQMGIRLAVQSFEESRISRDINKSNREIRIEEVDAYSANFDFTKTMNSKNKFYYGVEFVTNEVVSTGIDENISTGVSAPGPSRYPQADWSSYGAYLTGQSKLTDRFILQAGLRYSRFSLDGSFDTTFYPFPFTKAKMSNGSLTGSLGFVFRPTDEWVFSMNASTAFRAPNVDDIGKVFDSEPGAVTVPNPELEAEYAYNGDIGIARIFGESVKIDLSAYYTLLQNAMVRRNFQINGLDSIVYDGTLSRVQAIQNAAKANVYGVQASIEVRLPEGFGFSADLNYQVGEEELDDGSTSPSRHAAPFYGITKLTYNAYKLNMQLYAVFNGEKSYGDLPEEEKAKTEIYAVDTDGNPYSPGWYTLNFKAGYQLTTNITVNAGLENLSDQRYRPYSSGIASPGRNFIISVKASF